jgi:hypothetical protein
MICNRCKGTGFLNIEQAPIEVQDKGPDAVLLWMKNEREPHDVQVCGCCGDSEYWYGEAGQHYNLEDPRGKDGPYAYNGGLAECN